MTTIAVIVGLLAAGAAWTWRTRRALTRQQARAALLQQQRDIAEREYARLIADLLQLATDLQTTSYAAVTRRLTALVDEHAPTPQTPLESS